MCAIGIPAFIAAQHTAEQQMQELLGALQYFENMKFIFTKANADAGGRKINAIIDKFVSGPYALPVP